MADICMYRTGCFMVVDKMNKKKYSYFVITDTEVICETDSLVLARSFASKSQWRRIIKGYEL